MIPHFESHKSTKEMVHLKYFCDAQIQNGGPKRVRISNAAVMAVKAMLFYVIKNVVVNFVSLEL